jgi:hypothetical protein
MNNPLSPKRFHLTRPQCAQCVRLQEEIKRLREKVDGLERQLRYQQRQITGGYFGSSTSSAKKPFKANTKAERNNGGGHQGHRGYGRVAFDEQHADAVITIEAEHVCPDCQLPLDHFDVRDRSATEVEPVEVKKVVYKLRHRRCPSCRRIFWAKAPGVLPKFKQSNSVLAYTATEHYLEQSTFGHVAKRLDINESSLIDAMHHLAELFKAVPQKLIAEYRQAPVKQADEIPQGGTECWSQRLCVDFCDL